MNCSVLVIGELQVAQKRATDLRLRGYAAWIAANPGDLGWLLDSAWIRPDLALVDLTATSADRDQMLRTMAPLAAQARLPALLIGASEPEERRFQRVVASLPSDADVEHIVGWLTALPAR